MSKSAFSCIVAVLILLPALAFAIDLPGEDSLHRSCKLGVYLISLHDLNMDRDTFEAVLWFWSTCRFEDLHPLNVMDFVNANRIEKSLPATTERSGLYWSYVKIHGEFRHNYKVKNYPFDRHELSILVENTDSPASAFSYTADKEGSKVSRDLVLDGWQVTSFDIREETYLYDTTFGDPSMKAKRQSDYARLRISMNIERTKTLSFFKLATGLYVSVALSLLTFLLGPYNGRRRANLLVGTLFAVLVNHRVAETLIGRTEEVTLIDELHFIALIYIFAIAIAGIRSQNIFDQKREEEAYRFDRLALWIFCITYILINVAVVLESAITG